MDKGHVELPIAICEAAWCGWLSQAKADGGVDWRLSVNNGNVTERTIYADM